MRVFLLGAFLLPAAASAQVVTEMTPERIREAIKAGMEGDFEIEPYVVYDRTHTACGILTTPWSRVAMAAEEAKKKYKPFAEADATPEMLRPLLDVYVPAVAGKGYVSSVEAIVIVPDKGEVIQPTKATPEESTFSNRMGATWKGTSLTASFPLSAISKENELRIVMDRGLETRWRFKPDDMR